MFVSYSKSVILAHVDKAAAGSLLPLVAKFINYTFELTNNNYCVL